MPELPEVETVRRGLQPVLEGAQILKAQTNREDLRFPFPVQLAETLKGKTVLSLSRRAKYLLLSLSGNLTLVSHLGMSGSWRIENETLEVASLEGDHHSQAKNSLHDHFIMDVETQAGELHRVIYNDPRRFGFIFLSDSDKVFETSFLEKLGVEPTGNELSGEYLQARFKNRQTPLKAALLDQSHVAGLGNIYVCEALWRAKLSPLMRASSLANDEQKADELAVHIRAIIDEAIKAGGSSLRDYVQTDGSLGYFQHNFLVYNRAGEECSRCRTPIERFSQSGRSTFFCPSCQKP